MYTREQEGTLTFLTDSKWTGRLLRFTELLREFSIQCILELFLVSRIC